VVRSVAPIGKDGTTTGSGGSSRFDPTNFAVEASWTQQGRVQRVGAVGGHDHLDLSEDVKAIHLVEKLGWWGGRVLYRAL
jgi:hypothetical protein